LELTTAIMDLLYLPIVTTADDVVVGVETSVHGVHPLLQACIDVHGWTCDIRSGSR
jgi:hypothetical protein